MEIFVRFNKVTKSVEYVLRDENGKFVCASANREYVKAVRDQ